MKKIFYVFIVIVVGLCQSCMDDLNDPKSYTTHKVQVKLDYPEEYAAKAGVKVVLTNAQQGTVFESTTNAEGVAEFEVTPGLYNAAVSDKRLADGKITMLNGTVANKIVNDSWAEEDAIAVPLQASTLSQLIIKELYCGGCVNATSGKAFNADKYVIIYNNSDTDASLNKFCIGFAIPYNATGSNYDYKDGKLLYDLGADAWLPAGLAFWTLGETTTIIKPYEQIVVAFNNAKDLTAEKDYVNSVNLGKKEYYVTYDPSKFTNASLHPVPSATIPTSHYLTCPGKIGTSVAWALSISSPALFIFMAPESTNLNTFAAAPENQNLYNNSAVQGRYKIPSAWILDGIEVFQASKTDNKKRLISTVDGGGVAMTNGQGNTLYRNVDKEATEALAGNAGKIVYGYKYGTTTQVDGTTDPSGIDAEASIKNGARIVYMDTNNSTNDFHQRSQSSLRD